MLKQLQFNGELVVITGGASGIGRSCADTVAELGATVLIVDLSEDELREAAANIPTKSACEYFVANVTVEAQVVALSQFVAGRWGRLKAVINCAGNNFISSITELSAEKWHEIIAVDLDSIFYMCRAFIPLLLKGENPSILNVASSFGHIGYPKMPAYCAAKGGVISLTRQLAVDYGTKGLRVNSICPGPTLSPRVKGYFDRDPAFQELTQSQVMLGRLAKCDEIANVAAFLVSDAASYVHGASIMVDGGQTIN